MIALWENNRVPRREIARRLHRSPSTISRELANGKGEGRYRADEAQKRSVLRRQASHRTLRYQDPWIQQSVREKLSQCWSPRTNCGEATPGIPSGARQMGLLQQHLPLAEKGPFRTICGLTGPFTAL